MASQINRFAALSPEYEEEEAKRKKVVEQKVKKDVQKAKKDEAVKVKAEARTEFQEFEVAEGTSTQSERGHPRGMRRGTRGNRGGRGRGDYSNAASSNKFSSGKDYHFSGSSDPVHPFDRKSGTGRGKEIPKEGGGKANWGKPEDDLKYENQFAEEKEVVGEAPREEEKKEDEKKEGEEEKNLSKKEKKNRKKERKTEEKKEEVLDADGSAMTYSEYKAKMAEQQKIIPTKKAEDKSVPDLKKVAGLVAYEKPKFNPTLETAPKAPKKKEEEDDEVEPKKEVLGTFIGEERRGGRSRGRGYRGRGGEHPREVREEEAKSGEKPQTVAYPKEEPKKAAPATFVMKDEDFPTLK